MVGSFNSGDGSGEAVLGTTSSSPVHFTEEKMLSSQKVFRKEQ